MNLENKRVVGKLTNADRIMTHAFWLGVYPGIGVAEMEYVLEILSNFLKHEA